MEIDYTVSAVDPINYAFLRLKQNLLLSVFFAFKDFRLFVSVSKELLICFGAKLRCFQVFFALN